MNMLQNATVTTNGTLDFGHTPYSANSVCFKANGTFGGATVVLGYMSDASNTAVFCPYTDSTCTLTTSNQVIITTGRQSSLAVKVTGATLETKIYINLCPIEAKQ